MEAASVTAATAADDGEDDFFSSWDRPKASTPNPVATFKVAPPVVGRPASAPSTVSTPSATATPASSSPSSPLPRTTTSAAAGRSKLGSTRLGSSTTSTASSARPAKLGAKKAAAPINFDEAERRAREEEERIKKLGYDRKREEEEEAKGRLAERETKAKELGSPPPSATKPTGSTAAGKASIAAPAHKKGNSQDMARLGMGMARLGFGATAVSTPGSSSKKPR